MNIAYKLVSLNDHGQLTSCVSCIANGNDGNSWNVKPFLYTVGQIMRPPYGKFFVFGNLPGPSAIGRILGRILGATTRWKVYKCIVPKLIPAKSISARFTPSGFRNFWENNYYKMDPSSEDGCLVDRLVDHPIPDTFFASEVILIEDATYLISLN